MHACVLPLNIDQTEHAFLHPQGHINAFIIIIIYVRKKWLKMPNMRHCTEDTSQH